MLTPIIVTTESSIHLLRFISPVVVKSSPPGYISAVSPSQEVNSFLSSKQSTFCFKVTKSADMPRAKKIAYKKCHQCRKDRQKCLPEDRTWPGTKCERCQHYGYACSAMRTTNEELSMTPRAIRSHSPGPLTTTASNMHQAWRSEPLSSSASRSHSPDPSTTIASTLPQARKIERHCLQDLGDLRQLSTACSAFSWWNNSRYDCSIYKIPLEKALDAVKKEIMAWARQHEAGGRYRDAEYLCRRAISNGKILEEYRDLCPAEHVLPTLVLLYEKTEDYPAAEIAQETLLRHLFAENPEQTAIERSQAVMVYSRMLLDSRKRILDVVLRFDLEIAVNIVDLFFAYRVAVLDIHLLNEVSLDQSLINLKSPDMDILTRRCTSLPSRARSI